MSLAGASISGVATVLAKKYQKKRAKVTKVTDILTLALAMFETSVSKALNNHKIDEWEFPTLLTLHLGALNELTNVDREMAAETRVQFQKSLPEEINDFKKAEKSAS